MQYFELNIKYFRLEITTNGLKLFPVETVQFSPNGN
jgi:hypothetical protein